MSTSDNKPDMPAETDTTAPTSGSARAKAIARRSFLRRSAGVAAPVVMTLQSGPALAIRSITCADKTGQTDQVFDDQPTVHPRSGFITAGTEDLKVGDLTNVDPTTIADLAGNDGFVRCSPNTLHTITISPDTTGPFVALGPGATEWSFMGPQGGVGLSADPTGDTGALALFTINSDGEDVFEGCYGDGIETTLPEARTLTCSCWSSLNP